MAGDRSKVDFPEGNINRSNTSWVWPLAEDPHGPMSPKPGETIRWGVRQRRIDPRTDRAYNAARKPPGG